MNNAQMTVTHEIFVEPTSQGTVKSNKNVQLVLQHCCKTSWIAKLPVLTTMLKPVKMLHVGWILTSRFHESHAIHGVTWLAAKQVCHGPVKRATCTGFVAKSRSTLYFLQPAKTWFVQERYASWVVKRTTSIINSFDSNVTKQVAHFSCPFYLTLTFTSIRSSFGKIPCALRKRPFPQSAYKSLYFFLPIFSNRRLCSQTCEKGRLNISQKKSFTQPRNKKSIFRAKRLS